MFSRLPVVYGTVLYHNLEVWVVRSDHPNFFFLMKTEPFCKILVNWNSFQGLLSKSVQCNSKCLLLFSSFLFVVTPLFWYHIFSSSSRWLSKNILFIFGLKFLIVTFPLRFHMISWNLGICCLYNSILAVWVVMWCTSYSFQAYMFVYLQSLVKQHKFIWIC